MQIQNVKCCTDDHEKMILTVQRLLKGYGVKYLTFYVLDFVCLTSLIQ